MNLTAIREADDVARLHMLDCAALLGCCDFAGKRLLDVGTGAGFPRHGAEDPHPPLWT